jgi:pimeloyl-ACP methyl ester carboxylesterase
MQPSKIIIEAPFASAEVLVQDAALLAMPGSYFVNVKIDNAEEIKKVNVPLLWIHGEADSFLSIHTHGEVVYNNYQGPSKTAVRVPGGDHEDTPFIMGYSNYLAEILQFIEQ